ncbi:hypothetical protein EMIT0P44_50189 [Pseudomonas sp. IT-P44]
MPAPNLTETFSNSGLAPNCIVMLAVEIKGFSCEAFRVARVAAVPIQYPFPVFKPREIHPDQKRKVHLAISGQQQLERLARVEVR